MIKKVFENLKHVQAPTPDLSYYHNGTPGSKVPTFSNIKGLADKSEVMQAM